MQTLYKNIIKLNQIYRSMKKNFDILKKMFHNHSTILQSVILAEQMLNETYMKIHAKLTENEEHRTFNRIIKDIKNEKKSQ